MPSFAPLSADQLRVFLAVVEQGSFSVAARQLRRAQSAVSYAISSLEDQLQLQLFDRSGQRPVLTGAGAALLGDARRVAEDIDRLQAHALGLTRGTEAEIAIVVDAYYPIAELIGVLHAFSEAHPLVGLRLHVEPFGPALSMLLDGTCVLGIVADVPAIPADVERHPVGKTVEIVPVTAPTHPLAAEPAPLGRDLLREHVQLVLTDKSGFTRGRDYRVLSVRTWRLADLGAKHAMLLAGLGWGYMPTHSVAADLAAGRLVELTLAAGLDGARASLPMVILHRRSIVLGPASRWLLERIAA